MARWFEVLYAKCRRVYVLNWDIPILLVRPFILNTYHIPTNLQVTAGKTRISAFFPLIHQPNVISTKFLPWLIAALEATVRVDAIISFTLLGLVRLEAEKNYVPSEAKENGGS